MNPKLISAFKSFVDIMKKDEHCIGGWHFGSVARGLTDEFSDVDPVFVIDGNHFDEFDSKLREKFEQICDKVIVFWGESFNNDVIKNYGVDIKIGDEILQFDIFLLNSFKQDDWWFQQHYKSTKESDIIFDKDGRILQLIKNAPKGGYIPYYDIMYANLTYWHHANMIIKYFKRKDYFKLVKNTDILMQSHIKLLLSLYDKTTWGDWDSKLKYIPKDKQQHLMLYYASNDFSVMYDNIKQSIIMFSNDAKEIFATKSLEYPIDIEKSILCQWGL